MTEDTLLRHGSSLLDWLCPATRNPNLTARERAVNVLRIIRGVIDDMG